MGRGGASAPLPTPADAKTRSFLANTIPYAATDECKITKRSLREAIPAHCFERSYVHSFGALFWDLFMVVVAYQLALFASANAPAALSMSAALGHRKVAPWANRFSHWLRYGWGPLPGELERVTPPVLPKKFLRKSRYLRE